MSNLKVLQSATDTNESSDKSVSTSAAVMSDALAVFTIAGGPIEVISLIAVCITDNNVTASTLKFTADPTDGAVTDLCAASASLSNAVAGTFVNITGTLGDAGVIVVKGVAISQAGDVTVPVGIIQLGIGAGSTTGTWTINLRYRPIGSGVTVVAAY